MLTKEQVGMYVVRNGLDERTQRRDVAYKRFMLADYCRNVFTALTLQNIADLIGYDKHDMVVYGMKQHNKFKDDKLYRHINEDLFRLLYDIEPVTDEKTDLRTEILRIDSMIELHKLQRKIKRGRI